MQSRSPGIPSVFITDNRQAQELRALKQELSRERDAGKVIRAIILLEFKDIVEEARTCGDDSSIYVLDWVRKEMLDIGFTTAEFEQSGRKR